LRTVDGNRQDDANENVLQPAHVDAEVETSAQAAAVAAAPRGRLALGIVAGLVAGVVAVAAWVALSAAMDRDYVGIVVVFALVIGWLVREVSRRSDVPARVVAAVITAAVCLVGSTAAVAGDVASDYDVPFFRVFKDLLPDTFTLITKRGWWAWVIFAAAVVVAFLSAAPAQQPKGKRAKSAAPADADERADDD
jgi:hypothetical protein